MQLVQFLMLGIRNFIDCEFDASRTLRLLLDERIEIFCGVPTFFERISALPEFADADLSHITLAACGGARVALPLFSRAAGALRGRPWPLPPGTLGGKTSA